MRFQKCLVEVIQSELLEKEMSREDSTLMQTVSLTMIVTTSTFKCVSHTVTLWRCDRCLGLIHASSSSSSEYHRSKNILPQVTNRASESVLSQRPKLENILAD